MWIKTKWALVNIERYHAIAVEGGRVYAYSDHEDYGFATLWEASDGGLETCEEAMRSIADAIGNPAVNVLDLS